MPATAKTQTTQWANRLDRGCAILAAARAIVTRAHGPRAVIKKAGDVAHSRILDGRPREVRIAEAVAEFETWGAAFAWDRRVKALTKAIAGETRVLS